MIQGAGVEKAVEGTVLSVSQAPAGDNEWLHAYKALDDKQVKNPLAYYEVAYFTDSDVESVPFGTNVNAVVVVNEAQEAISVKEKWLNTRYEESASVWMIDTGPCHERDVETPLVGNPCIVLEGLKGRGCSY